MIEDGNSEAITEKLDDFIAHTIEHFYAEEKMMLAKAFPAYPMHKAEHERALAQMKEKVAEWKANKDLNALKHYIEVMIPEWLIKTCQYDGHCYSMFSSRLIVHMEHF